jgi:hypothetical protein
MDNCSWQLKFIHQEVSIYHLAKYTDIASVFIKPSYSKIFSLLFLAEGKYIIISETPHEHPNRP